MLWAYATFALASLLAVASPGPAFIAISHTTLNRPRSEALAFGLGLALTATFWTALALFGLTAIFALVPWLYGSIKLAGGLYLIWLALKLWRGADAPIADPQTKSRHGAMAFVSGVAINLTNPKSVLFAGTIVLAIFPAEMTLGQKLLILAVMLTIEISFFSSLVLWLSRPNARAIYLRAKLWIDRAAGAVLGALGLSFLLSRP